MKNIKVTHKQLVQLLVTSRVMVAITFLPIINAPPKNQDVWIVELISIPIMILLSIPVYVLWRKFPDYSIIQYSKILMGKLGVLVQLLICWFFIHTTSLTLAQFGEFLSVAVMQETPRLFFIITMLLASCYSVYKGFEVMGRTSELVFPIIVISIITITIFLLKEINLDALKPILEKGIVPIFYGVIPLMSRNVEILALAMVLPSLNDGKKAEHVFIYYFLLSILIFLLVTVPVVTIWGVENAKILIFPYYSLIKVVDVGGFVQRIDAIHMGIWVLGFYLRISLYFYLSVLSISEIFSFANYKPLIFPVASIIVPLSVIIAPSMIELREFLNYKILTPYSLFYIVLIPFLLLLIAMIRKKGEKLK